MVEYTRAQLQKGGRQMVTEASTGDSNRPYAPPSNVTSILQRVRSRNLPERIDPEYLRDAGIPEGTVHRTFFALKFLGLLDEEGELTSALKSIATSTDEEYRSILSGLIRDRYSDVFSVVDPAEDAQDQILNVFRRYTPGSQRKRMVIFFLGMCREAGIATLDVPRPRAMGRSREVAETRPRVKTSGASVVSKGVVRAKGTVESRSIPPALEGLVRSLPAVGTPLSARSREQWLKMASATLAFLYPEEGAPDGTPDGGDGIGR